MELFSSWIEPKKEIYLECLEDDLKVAAYRLMTKQKNMQLTKLVATVYEFRESKQLFVPLIEVKNIQLKTWNIKLPNLFCKSYNEIAKFSFRI